MDLESSQNLDMIVENLALQIRQGSYGDYRELTHFLKLFAAQVRLNTIEDIVNATKKGMD